MSQKFLNPVEINGQVSAEYLDLSTSTSHSVNAGEIAWNSIDGTFDIGLLNGVTLQAGQEMHFYGKATEVIFNGNAVMFAGVQGDHILIAKADAVTINANPEYFMGVATQDFTTNQFGYVTAFGNVRGIDTSTYRLGDILYYDSISPTDGLLTPIIPLAPKAKIIVAAVVKVHATEGILAVRPHTMPKLNGLQDVNTNQTKSSLIDADSFLIQDTADSNVWKRFTWQNLKSNLKTYFDTFYLSLSIFNDFVTDVFDSLDNKLDKSTTASSIYGTNTAGGQTMIPLSSLGSDSETFRQSTWMFSDFYSDNVYQPPFTGSALSGGLKNTASFSDSVQDFLGSSLLLSGTSANGGYRFLDAMFNGFRTGANLTFFGVFRLINQSDARDRVIRIGFHNATNHVAPADGAFLEILGSTATFKTRNNNVESSSSSVSLSSGDVVSGIFYKVLIEFISTTSVNCKVVDNSGNVVLNVNNTTNLPTTGRRFGCGITATITTAGLSHQIAQIDYMGVGREKPNFLNDF